MTTIADRLAAADPAALTSLRARTITSGPPAGLTAFKVSRLRDKVIVTRADDGGLVLDINPASARHLARQLDIAAGPER